MDIDQWLEDAAAAPGYAAWPSPEQQAEAQMEPQVVNTFPKFEVKHGIHSICAVDVEAS